MRKRRIVENSEKEKVTEIKEERESKEKERKRVHQKYTKST